MSWNLAGANEEIRADTHDDLVEREHSVGMDTSRRRFLGVSASPTTRFYPPWSLPEALFIERGDHMTTIVGSPFRNGLMTFMARHAGQPA